MAAQPRYQIERVPGSPDVEALQDRIMPVLERLSLDREEAAPAATAGGTSYAPARTADWAGTAPTTLAEAQDRIAYHIASGGGTAPIRELP